MFLDCFLSNTKICQVSKSPQRTSFEISSLCFLTTSGSCTQYFLSCIRKKITSTFGLISKLDNFEILLVSLCFRKSLIFRNHIFFRKPLKFRKHSTFTKVSKSKFRNSLISQSLSFEISSF